MLSPIISFGQKIPVLNCKVKDNKQNKFVEATLFQLDCKDDSDLKVFEDLDDSWIYKEDVLSKMKNVRRTIKFKSSPNSFYELENSKGEVIGFVQTKNEIPNLIIDFLESEHGGKYSYVGQNILAMLSTIAIENNFKKIVVPVPIREARDFYIEKCGFKNILGDCAISLSRRGMEKLQKKMDRLA